MQAEHVQQLVSQLQAALGISVPCGTITLNMNDGSLQSVKQETHLRIVKSDVDRRAGMR